MNDLDVLNSETRREMYHILARHTLGGFLNPSEAAAVEAYTIALYRGCHGWVDGFCGDEVEFLFFSICEMCDRAMEGVTA